MSNPVDPGARGDRIRPDRIKLPGGPKGPEVPEEPVEPERPGALRLIYEYENGEVKLVSQQRVDVAVPGFDLSQDAIGDQIEVRDSAGIALTRVAVRNAAPDSVEVFGEPGEAITRMPDPGAKGAFTVIVPAPPEAARVVLQRATFARRRFDAFGIAPAPAPGEGDDGDQGDQAADETIVLSDDAIEG